MPAAARGAVRVRHARDRRGGRSRGLLTAAAHRVHHRDGRVYRLSVLGGVSTRPSRSRGVSADQRIQAPSSPSRRRVPAGRGRVSACRLRSAPALLVQPGASARPAPRAVPWPTWRRVPVRLTGSALVGAQVTGMEVQGPLPGHGDPACSRSRSWCRLLLVWMVDGLRGLRETWPPGAVSSAVFCLVQGGLLVVDGPPSSRTSPAGCWPRRPWSGLLSMCGPRAGCPARPGPRDRGGQPPPRRGGAPEPVLHLLTLRRDPRVIRPPSAPVRQVPGVARA
ncbi:hypothetical protein QJS66_21440 [Kocuria rhizophila]|nr:hypothetical protein QJS66_21440 [Kocuria rhizophila]